MDKQEHKTLIDVAASVDEYLSQIDWRVNANANQGYSLGGLILNVSGKVIANYWLNHVYASEIGEAHRAGDLHIHDLDMLSGYCAGWSLRTLLTEGFNGIANKVEATPPKHLSSAVGQMVNFLGTLQNEWAGAQAFSSMDSYLAPLVRKDNLSYPEVKQCIQELIYNLNVPSRWGCVPLDTEILTKEGWKLKDEISVSDKVYGFQDGNIIDDEILAINEYDFDGKLISFSNRSQEQLLTPNHRVLRLGYNDNKEKFFVDEAEALFEAKSPVNVPIAGHIVQKEYAISDDLLQLYAWILSEGSIPKQHASDNRIVIHQSPIKNKEYCDEIERILERLGLTYRKVFRKQGLGQGANIYRLSHPFSRELSSVLKKQELPMDILRKCSERQIKLFIHTYRKGDGEKKRFRITTKDEKIKDNFQELATLVGYGTKVIEVEGTISGKILYRITFLTKGSGKITLTTKKKLNYKGKVWCPTTGSSYWIARRKCSVFITGNSQTPFTNLTFDWTCPEDLREQIPYIGGEEMPFSYGDLQAEMDMINCAFIEVMTEGDAKGRIFTFPIPTYNITPDFPWDSPNTNLLFEMTARYGLPYFQNFIRSDLKPNMVRSMCLFPEETILFKKNEQIRKTTIGTLFAEYKDTQLDDEWWQCKSNVSALSLNPQNGKLEWVKINKFLRITDNRLVSICSKDGKLMRLSADHLVAILTRDGIETKKASDIKMDDFVLVVKDASRILNQESVTDDVEIDSSTIDRWNLTNEKIEWLRNSDFAAVPVTSVNIENLNHPQEFYDIELEKNHYFVHSNGNISHNCCRLQLDLTELLKRGNGLFGSVEMTGSLGVVTINCARLGYLYKGDETALYQRLDTLLKLGKDSLEVKRKVIQQQMDNGLFPFTKRYLGTLRNHFSTIGVNGINEMIRNFTNDQQDITTEWGQEFAISLLDHIRTRMVEFQEETRHMYNLEATPAEGTTYRFAKEDKKRYPDIIQAGTHDRPYYTNSSQLPVGFTDDPFEALELQDELQTKYTGGCIEKGNKVITDKGAMKIEDIVKHLKSLSPLKALSYNPKTRQSEWNLITDGVIIDVAKHDKIKIVAEKGVEITTSDWHPFFVMEKVTFANKCPICEKTLKNEKALATHMKCSPECCKAYHNQYDKYQVKEKRADELDKGDYILQNAQNLLPEKSQLKPELAYFLGFFIGDGSISEVKDNRGGNNLTRYIVRFFSEAQPTLEKIAHILNRFFDCHTKPIQNDKRSEKLFEIVAGKKSVLDFLFQYQFFAGKKVYTITIPFELKCHLSKENFYNFLAGLIDSDGHVSKRDGAIEYYTVSEKLADDIVEMCTIAGVLVSKHKKITKRDNEVDIYRVLIPAYQTTSLKDKLPLQRGKEYLKDVLSNRLKRQLPIVRVLSASKVEVQDNEFYDLTIEYNHNYLAGNNSFVFVHNTVNHLYMNERISSAQTCKTLVRRVLENYHLPYITITPTFSICPKHGYLAGEHEFCPLCDKEQLKKKEYKIK